MRGVGLAYAVDSDTCTHLAITTASLRDDGWFWWMPLAGRLPYFKDSAYPDVPFPPRRVKAD